MKKVCFIFIITIALLFTGCNDDTIYYWEFEYEVKDVIDIKIIDAESSYDYSVVKELDVSVAPELYSDIEDLPMKSYGYNLSHPFDLCFLIVFKSGEYDIIAREESKRHRYNGERMVGYNSWLCCCDETEFDALIEKYMVLAD